MIHRSDPHGSLLIFMGILEEPVIGARVEASLGMPKNRPRKTRGTLSRNLYRISERAFIVSDGVNNGVVSFSEGVEL